MEVMRYLLDSNVLIDILALRFEGDNLDKVKQVIDDAPYISVVTKIEVLGFSSGSTELDDRTVQFVNLFHSYELTSDVVDRTIAIRKVHKIKIADAIIAATALINGLILLTSNTDDFKSIAGLQLADPHKL